MKLKIPEEPKEILVYMRSVSDQMKIGSSIDWDSFSVWAANKLPQYLWHEWKEELKSRGFTWQKFLKLLRTRTDTVLAWFKGARGWERTVNEIMMLIEEYLEKEFIRGYTEDEIQEIIDILEKQYFRGINYSIKNLKIDYDDDCFFSSPNDNDIGAYVLSFNFEDRNDDKKDNLFLEIDPFPIKLLPKIVAYNIASYIWTQYDHACKSKLGGNIPKDPYQ